MGDLNHPSLVAKNTDTFHPKTAVSVATDKKNNLIIETSLNCLFNGQAFGSACYKNVSMHGFDLLSDLTACDEHERGNEVETGGENTAQ